MSGELWKAVRPDGLDFWSGRVDYGAALLSGVTVRHPDPDLMAKPDRYLSVASVPTDCTGMDWPCRLLRVEPVGATRPDPELRNKVRCEAVRVVGEVPGHVALGPQGVEVAEFIAGIPSVMLRAAARGAAWAAAQAAAWDAAWGATQAAAWGAAQDAAWDAARDAAWAATWAAAWAAARAAAWGAAWGAAALVTRDLIPAETYNTLTRPWLILVDAVEVAS